MRVMILVVGLMLAMPSVAAPPANSTPTAIAANADLDRPVAAFIDKLAAGRTREAVDGLMASSPLFAGKEAMRDTVLAQLDEALRTYGPVARYEVIEHKPVGSMFVRRRYFVQHKEMVTRWEFDFVRTERGWVIGYFGFDDSMKNWVDGAPIQSRRQSEAR